jgi:ABC-2 type transport system permease protein
MRPVLAVVARELRRLPRLPVLWTLLGPIPLAAMIVLVGVFDAEVARALPLGLLDLDGTEASRTAARWVGAARSVSITRDVQDLGEAESLVLEREVYAVLVIPHHFQRDLLRGRSPRVTLLYNEQYLTAGNSLSADVARAIGAGAGPVAVELRRSGSPAQTAANPIAVDSRLLFNPGVSYAVGVGLVLIVGILQVVSGLSGIYAVGRELRDATAPDWLAAAGGSRAAAWLGKLAPYVVWDLLLTLVLVGGYAAWFRFPVRGHVALLAPRGALVLAREQGDRRRDHRVARQPPVGARHRVGPLRSLGGVQRRDLPPHGDDRLRARVG